MSSVLALVMCLILCVPAFAATITTGNGQNQVPVVDAGEKVEDESPMTNGDSAPETESPMAEVGNAIEGESPTEEQIDTAAANRITFTNWALTSIRIPDSTSMLSKGVVLNGIITYEVKIKVQVKNNGSNYANQSVTWNTSASTSNAKIITKDTRTNASGIAKITFHVRGIEKLPVTITCASISGSKTIDLGTRATYITNFQRTHYITALESDYKGQKISVAGLSGTYRRDFLADVKVQGSGKGEDGKYISYYGGKYSYRKPTTATGTEPKVGQTIAVDSYYIPRVLRNGSYYRGYVTVQGGIGHRIAEDSGGGIVGRHIDDYVGVGKSSLDSKDGYYQILFMGVNSDGRSASNNFLLSDSTDVEADGLEESAVFTPRAPVTCKSEDGTYFAYEGDADASKVNSITVSVVRNGNDRNTSDDVKFDLAPSVTSVDNMEIANNSLVTIGHVNPSVKVYQEFNIDTQELIKQYYGFGFTNTNKGLFYVEAPQHFSGVIGLNRIMDGSGNVLYESDENVRILGDLTLNGSTLSFTEFNTESGESSAQTVSITARLDSVSSYYA